MELEKNKVKYLLKYNIVFDAFGTSIFSLGIGYYNHEYLILEVSDVLLTMGISVIVGTSMSYFSSALCDYIGAKKSLIFIQILQLLTCFLILVRPFEQLTLFFIFIYFVLGRMLSPIRGTLPPAYLSKDTLIKFKASVRSSTLIAVSISSGIIWLTVTTFENVWDGFSIVFILLDLVTFFVCLILTILLPTVKVKNPPKKPFSIVNLGKFGNLLWILFLIGFAISGICGATIPFQLPLLEKYGSMILILDFILGIVIAKISEFIVKKYEKYFSINHIMNSVLLSLMLSILSATIIYVSIIQSELNIKIYLLIISMILSEISLTVLSINLWNAQYEYGNEDRRGAVVGFYSMSSSYGSSLSPILAAKLFN